MTYYLGRFWPQPDRSQILVDDQYAVMTRATLEALPKYSNSNPSGVYDGKMWRRGLSDDSEWILCWYGPSDDPGKCPINSRRVLVIDDPAPVGPPLPYMLAEEVRT